MKGLLLVNTGSPKTAYRKDVRAFIEAMLSDPLVMTVPDWVKPILVKGIIGPFRQFTSASHYRMIWGEDQAESPLLHSALQLASDFEKQFDIVTEVGMRYLEPSIAGAMAKIAERGDEISELIALPLFPQYAESSYKTAAEEIMRTYKEGNYPFELRIIEPYFKHEAYIKALVKSISPYLDEEYDRILFNFHSLPLNHVEKGFEQGKEFDYVFQVKETVRLVISELNIEHKKARIVYSSAFGANWLEPSLADQLKEMGQFGLTKILVVSPGFAADNLETLFDIDIEAKEVFLKNGGKELVYIPCLNNEQYWVDAIQQIII